MRCFAIPNGAHLAKGTAQRSKQVNKLKAEGMEAGIPDLFLPVARKRLSRAFYRNEAHKRQRDEQRKRWMILMGRVMRSLQRL